MSALQDIALNLDAETAGQHKPAQPAAPATLPGRWQRWFGQLSIGGKITLFFSVNLGFALLAGLFVVAGYVELGQRAEHIRTTHDAALKAERLLVQLSEGQRHSELLVADGDTARARSAREALDRAAASAAALSERSRNGSVAEQDRLALIRAGIGDLGRQVTAYTPAADSAARQRQAAEIAATSDAVLEAAQDMAAALGEEAGAMADDGAALINRLLVMWIGLATILTLITLFAQRYFNRTVGATLKAIAHQMTAIAAGTRDVAISGKDREDEIGEMARATEIFHRAGLRLEKLSRERETRAKAELDEHARQQVIAEEARRERERMIAGIADQFERTVGEVVTGVVAASSQLQSTAALMANTAEDASSRTGEAASAMQEANLCASAAAAAVAPRLASCIAMAASPVRDEASSAVLAISDAVDCSWLEAATTPVTTSPTVRSNCSAMAWIARSRSSRASSRSTCWRACSSSSARARSARSRPSFSSRRPARWNTSVARAISPISSRRSLPLIATLRSPAAIAVIWCAMADRVAPTVRLK